MKVGDQSTFIQVNFDPCEEIKFFHQFKRKSKLSEKVYMFSSAHRQRLSNRLGQRTIRSQVSVIFILLLSQKKNEDRQWQTDKETASPKGRQNESNQNDYVKKKTKYFPQQFWTKWVEKKGWGGMGRGRRREKKNELVTTKWLILSQRRKKTNNICHYKIATEKVE